MTTTEARGRAIDPIPSGDVELVAWPYEADRRRELDRTRTPRLLLVAAGAAPPTDWSDLEDWIRLPADPGELQARRTALVRRVGRRVPVVLDADDGIVRRGRDWVALAPLELALIEPLLAKSGHVVSRSELLGALRPEQAVDDNRSIDAAMQRARRRVAPLGLSIHALRNVGFLLEIGVPPGL